MSGNLNSSRGLINNKDNNSLRLSRSISTSTIPSDTNRLTSFWAHAYPEGYLASPPLPPQTTSITTSSHVTSSSSVSPPTSPRHHVRPVTPSSNASSVVMTSSVDSDRNWSSGPIILPPRAVDGDKSSMPSSASDGNSEEKSSSNKSVTFEPTQAPRVSISIGDGDDEKISDPSTTTSASSSSPSDLQLNLSQRYMNSESAIDERRRSRSLGEVIRPPATISTTNVRTPPHVRRRDNFQSLGVYRVRPQWVPDDLVPFCSNCTMEFTWRCRRV